MLDRDVVNLHPLTWPAPRLGEAIEHLARWSGLLSQLAVDTHPLPEHLNAALRQPFDGAQDKAQDGAGEEMLGRWLEGVASQLGLEAEPAQSTYAEVDQLVRGAGPAVLRLPSPPNPPLWGGPGGGSEPRFLALLKGGRRVALVGPDLSVHRVRPDAVRQMLCQAIEAPHVETVDQLLVSAGVPEHRRARARRSILAEQLGPVPIRGCWLLRLSPGASLWRQARQARLVGLLLVLIGSYSVQQSLTIVAWVVIGRSALKGHIEWGWLLGWAAILLTAIAFQGLTMVAQNRFITRIGGLFQSRLLYGTLRLAPDAIRHQGAGQFLGRVMESETLASLAQMGGITAVLALIQLGMAVGVLALGAGGWPHALLLVLWLAVTLLISWRYLQRSHAWVDSYREMTNDLIERMVGHRTRLAQEDRAHWHDGEDQAVDHYWKLSEHRDHTGTWLSTLILRGWMIVGLAAFVFAFVVAPQSTARLAISLGGVLLALQALTSVVAGVQSVVDATLGWQQVRPLFEATVETESGGAGERGSRDAGEITLAPLLPRTPAPLLPRTPVPPLVVARELHFRYREGGRPVLEGCSLEIHAGDRLLLEGPSGGGKSTLAALLTGLRVPESGLLLLRGFDRQSLGTTEWRRRVVTVPQFHENHVFTGTFAYNLLMGRRWPPWPEDLVEAEAVCHELGLGELLERMPAGVQQMIGESGWQLSHGERSRLFIARAILQGADLVILDESFGALDPENLQLALDCVLKRAPTLMVIAHP